MKTESVKNLFSIVKATLDIVMDCDGNVAENFGDQILNAKVLSLSSDILQALLAANRNLSCLPNLIDLAVTPCDCGSYHSDFLDLLQTAPNLKRLKLTRTSFGEERLILQCTKSTLGSFKFNCYRGSAEYIDAKRPLNEEQIVPQCIKSSLEFFKFGFYRGNEEAMEILDYMLSNGKVLKVIQMLTSFPKHFRKKYEKKLLKKLAMFPHIESLLIGNLCFT
ncbi:uncharacterized protein LOC126671294 [Mercurialis annua]|uniref:uncharacterized protein LOC126671294 n=1 Tax=Mercurialis annua TaxID=3986 RepID=UPI002160B845|nr:uncharacterized protein LOC126671294 [Mercurialis annua]